MTAPYGWCPSVLRPMPLEDGLMIRIRPWLGVLSAAQAQGLAELAGFYGVGVIELTNRANIQLRGLSGADHDAIVPKLDDLGLTRIDRTPSARVNLTVAPIWAESADTERLTEALSTALTAAEFADLPQKFGFLIDPGPVRRMGDIVGDIRIERSGAALVVRPAGRASGREVASADDAAETALALARWFIGAGVIGPDGRGRMASAIAEGLLPPAALLGDARPNTNVPPALNGTAWLTAPGGALSPDALGQAALSAPLHVTPFRALYIPDLDAGSGLASVNPSGDNAGQPAPVLSDPT